jgi:hypothetical protein
MLAVADAVEFVAFVVIRKLEKCVIEEIVRE